MSALLTSLPGDIPGLLWRGSPIIAAETYCGVVAEDPAGCSSALVTLERDEDTMSLRLEMLHALALDLTDPTGRAHAARWVYHHPAVQGYTGLTREESAVMETALHFDPMTPTQIDILARLVLRLAGRAFCPTSLPSPGSSPPPAPLSSVPSPRPPIAAPPCAPSSPPRRCSWRRTWRGHV